jgi:hypothetical protein
LYLKTCAPCHGAEGKGDGVQDQRDDQGLPIRPRDFTRGIFKGGRDRNQLYVRIRAGMPGTPMPSDSNLSADQVGDLINFILSLSTAGDQAKVEHRRQRLVAKLAPGPLGDRIPEEYWMKAEPVPIVVSPLWWRNYPEPALTVATLHDDTSAAIRLTWRDSTCDNAPIRPQDFEDMAALQLFKGDPEPFLGMGAIGQPVDVWLWQASWDLRADSFPDVDTAHPDMSVDLYPFEKPGTGPRSHEIDRQPTEFLTARAAGNLRSDPDRSFTGSDLGARGFGTLTMRPRLSQCVQSKGSWKDGTWTVVLRRPLTVRPDAGIALSPGDRVSIAFAIWDGSQGDRNGQKLVSIWHDLELEQSPSAEARRP